MNFRPQQFDRCPGVEEYRWGERMVMLYSTKILSAEDCKFSDHVSQQNELPT